jgi:RecJ-like exonuclease
MGTIECPRCKGQGTVFGVFPVYASEVPPEDRRPLIEIPCPTCRGEGSLTAMQQSQIRAGELLRQFRKDKGYGLRSCSEAINVSALHLSEVEQGYHGFDEIRKLDDLIRALPPRQPA